MDPDCTLPLRHFLIGRSMFSGVMCTIGLGDTTPSNASGKAARVGC